MRGLLPTSQSSVGRCACMFSKTISVRWRSKWRRAAQGNPARASNLEAGETCHSETPTGSRESPDTKSEDRKHDPERYRLKQFRRYPVSLKGETFNDNPPIYHAERRYIYHSGGDSREDPPVPIPNTEVKLSYAESTWPNGPGG